MPPAVAAAANSLRRRSGAVSPWWKWLAGGGLSTVLIVYGASWMKGEISGALEAQQQQSQSDRQFIQTKLFDGTERQVKALTEAAVAMQANSVAAQTQSLSVERLSDSVEQLCGQQREMCQRIDRTLDQLEKVVESAGK